MNTFNNEALFVERAGGMALLVREGMAAPGIPGRTFGGNSVTADFGDVINNRLDHAAFTARVAGGSGTEYVLYSNHTGTLLPVARPGDPAPGYARFRTPVRDLWLCGSSTHPGGGIMGANGRIAALEVLRSRGRRVA